MAGVKYKAKHLWHSVDWTAQQKWTLFFKISLVNTDKPVRKVIQKYLVWDKLNEAICYQQILI